MTERTAAAIAEVRAVRSPRMLRLFSAYLTWYAGRHFDAVRRSGAEPVIPSDRPLIVYCNHPSWWDAALLVMLSTTVFRDREAYGPMDEAGLAKYPFMRKLGIFGIEPETRRGAAKFLRVSLGLLATPRSLLWITAQGHFTDARQRPVRLRPGLAHLARQVPNALIVPMAIEYPFWDERTPEFLYRFGQPIPADPTLDVDTWALRLEDALALTMDELAAASLSRDPKLFETVIGGTVGVGGVYDLWRRLKAAARLRSFRPGHREEA